MRLIHASKTKMTSLALCLLLGSTDLLFSQQEFFQDVPVAWSELKKPRIPEVPAQYAENDLVILDDHTEFRFFENNRYLSRHLLIRINTAKGLSELVNFKLPESFDPAYDAFWSRQGRSARITSPYIPDFRLRKFSVRKHVSGQWRQMKFKDRYEKVRWTKAGGEFWDEDIPVLQIQDLKAGDVIQIYYEAGFEKAYGENLFYFYAAHPKLSAEYVFVYNVDRPFADHLFSMAVNVPDSLVSKTRQDAGDKIMITQRVRLNDVAPVNYPANSFEAKTLPHVYVNLNFMRVLRESLPSDGGGRLNEYEYIKPRHFEWIFLKDTGNHYTRIYDKHYTGLRKFVATLPPLHPDSANLGFFRAFCDTINRFRYITRNHLYYNESHLYHVSTIDHLSRRRIVGSPRNLCRDILNDNQIFYYQATIQDRRFGEHNPYYRVHYAYEQDMIAIPSGSSYLYFLLRPGGVPYHVNELPFYLEGSLAALYPRNFQKKDTAKQEKFFKFIKTHKGTYNVNARTENTTVKILTEEKRAELVCKESLSGQFSTLLRHLYLNEYIDSTVSAHYFRKCTDKPFSSETRTRLSSKVTEFPFRYTFNCSQNIRLDAPGYLDLSNWFSFTLGSGMLPEPPTHDYFFDFEFSDGYNFLLDFDRPVQLKNQNAFRKKTDNAYFELDSEIVKQSDNAFLLRVKLLVKQPFIPLEDMTLLMDLVRDLDALNRFRLEYSGA